MAEIIRSPLSGGIRAARNTVPSSLFRTNETDPVFGRWLQNNNGIGNALAATICSPRIVLEQFCKSTK